MSVALVISIHNYKTAGVTFYSIIDRQFKKEQVLNANIIGIQNLTKLLAEANDEYKKSIKIIHGHFPFGLDASFSQTATYVTFLRNPIERVISDYFYCKGIYLAHNHSYASKMTFKEYLTCSEILNIDNGQTRFIAGDMNTPFGENSEAMLEKAKKNIDERFSFVGITEKFDESLILANYLFSWKKYYYQSKNVTSEKKIDLDEETLELLKQRNRLDLELYEYALRRHKKEMAKIPLLGLRRLYLSILKKTYNLIHPSFLKARTLIKSIK